MILCLGLSPALDITYLLDALEPGAIHRPNRVLALPGGKSLNTARAAASLHAVVRAVAPLGGFSGARIERELSSLAVPVTAVPVTGETRMCVTVFGQTGTDPTEFYERAPELSETEWAGVARAVAEVTDGWLALSGSVAPVHAAAVADLLAEAAERGIRIAVDTHGEALPAILDRIDPAVVKVNRAEAAELFGEASAADLAEHLRRTGAATAVVTDGAAGSVVATSEGRWHAVPPERGRFAVGSGDCFFAGLLVALDAGATTAASLSLATAVATANTLQPGAAVFDLADVDRLRRRTAVTPIESDAAQSVHPDRDSAGSEATSSSAPSR